MAMVTDDYFSGEYEEGSEPCSTEYAEEVYHNLSLYVHSVIVVLGLLGNLLVIITYAFYKKTKSMTDVYLLNVAVADILFVVVLPLIIYNEQNEWVMGAGACKFLRGAYSLNLYSGVLLLGCISGDRYLAIVCASRSRYLRSRTLVYSHAICAVVWFMALMISLPTFIYSELYEDEPEMYLFFNGSESYSNYTEPTSTAPPVWANISESTDYGLGFSSQTPDITKTWQETESQMACILLFNESSGHMKIVIPSLQMGIGFLLPLTVMTFCYTCIILTLLKARNFQRHKAVRVVLTVVLVFILCHLPYNLTRLVHTITLREQKECSSEIAILVGLSITETLAYLHCCLNPFLYAFVGVRFRSHFQKVLRDLWCVGKDYIRARRPSSRITSEICLSTRKSFDGSNTDNGTSFTM